MLLFALYCTANGRAIIITDENDEIRPFRHLIMADRSGSAVYSVPNRNIIINVARKNFWIDDAPLSLSLSLLHFGTRNL